MTADRVRLTIDSLSDAARPARVAGAGMAFRLGLSYQQVEDLRVAIDEVFLLASTYLDGAVQVTYSLFDDALTFALSPNEDHQHQPPETEAMATFSSAVDDLVASHNVDADGIIHLRVERPERDKSTEKAPD